MATGIVSFLRSAKVGSGNGAQGLDILLADVIQTEGVASGSATVGISPNSRDQGVARVTAVGGAIYFAEGITVSATTGIYLPEGDTYHVNVGFGGKIAVLDA